MRKVTDTTKPPYPTEQVHASSDNSSLPSERSAWKSHLELEGMGCAEVHVLYSFDQGAFISWVAKHAIKAYVSKSGPWLVLNSGKYEFAYNLLMSCWTRSQGRHPDNYATNQIITVVCYSQKYFHWVKKRIEKFFIYLFLHFHFFLMSCQQAMTKPRPNGGAYGCYIHTHSFTTAICTKLWTLVMMTSFSPPLPPKSTLMNPWSMNYCIFWCIISTVK